MSDFERILTRPEELAYGRLQAYAFAMAQNFLQKLRLADNLAADNPQANEKHVHAQPLDVGA